MLEDFNLDDLFLDLDKDVLPDLEVEPGEVDLADFSFDEDEEFRTADETTAAAGDLSSADNGKVLEETTENNDSRKLSQENKEVAGSTILKDDDTVEVSTENSSYAEADTEGKKSSTVKANARGSHGKRKVKVDWTPELHRRFVQAVEELGIDKAVPSRILEIMGIDCLTRHNVASHLQKYRSHWRHLLAREAEAATWSHRRRMYATAAAACKPNLKRDKISGPLVEPAMGFPSHPPSTPVPPLQMHHHFSPLQVWGHPTMDMWPKHFAPGTIPTPPPPWLRPPPPHPTPWLPHYSRGPNAVTQGTPCFPRPVQQAMRFPPPAVACVPPQLIYTTSIHPDNKKLGSQLQLLDAPPSKESVDAALGDVLVKPWSPLPLGLKPPSLDSVLMELQKQGISNVPVSPTSS